MRALEDVENALVALQDERRRDATLQSADASAESALGRAQSLYERGQIDLLILLLLTIGIVLVGVLLRAWRLGFNGLTYDESFTAFGEPPGRWLTRERLARTQSMAAELNITPGQIALAWLMHQDFPVIPILGTAKLEHLTDAMGSARVQLTAQQVTSLAQD